MGLYTNEGLVKHAENALKLKTKYMWGGLLRLVEKQYDVLFSYYGIDPAKGYTKERWNKLAKLKNKGVYGVDCVGLIKSYYWSGKADGGVGSPKYGAAGYPDTNAGDMYNAAKVKGRIATIPERPGVIVYSKSHPHVGIYVGNGYTIESTLGARGDGVVKRKLDSLWEYWFECPYIEYIKDKPGQAVKPETADSSFKSVTLAFNASIRTEPRADAPKLGVLTAGTKCVIVKGSETEDKKTKYKYVRLAGELEQWIVVTAIKT